MGVGDDKGILFAVEMLLRRCNGIDAYGQTFLEVAAKNGSMEMVKLLVDNKADLKKKNRYGQPAMEAAFTTAMLHGREQVARYFLDVGADVNAMGPGGRTALLCAVQCSPEFVKLILDKGANVNGKCRDGQTAVMAAVRSGKVETTRMLLDRGA